MEKIPWMRDHLTDGRISLRRYCTGDSLTLYEAIQESITELTRWGFYHQDFTRQDAEKEVEARIAKWNARKSFTYLIEQPSVPELVGVCNISEYEPENNHAALGWWVRTSMTRQGIATSAGRLVAQAAFEDLHLSSLSIYARVDNIASRRVAEKLGAVLVRIKPEEVGSDCAVYELKPETLV